MFHDRARIYVQAAPAGTASFPSGARRTCRRAVPTAATAAAAATSRSWWTRRCATCPASGAAPTSRPKRGGHGEGANSHGATPDTLEMRVPPGTVVEDAERGDRWELLNAGERAVVARGGSGGRGNRQFATATRQTPRFAERGLPGEERTLELQLRLKADAGLVGLPNAGQVVAARPAHARAAEGGGLPVHHARAGARHARARRPPARAGRHPRPDRGRQRRRRARPRVPRPRRALPAARARARPGAARRLGPGAELRDGRGRAARARARPRRAAAAPLPVEGRPRAAGGGAGGGASGGASGSGSRCSPPRPRPATGLEELRDAIFRARAAGGARRRAAPREHAGHPPRLPARAAASPTASSAPARARSAWRAGASSG